MSKTSVVEAVLAWKQHIESAALAHGLDFSVLAGLVAQESAGLQYAQRYEPLYSWTYNDPKMSPAIMSWDTFQNGQKVSYGLCQIMGGVALEYGWRGWWGELFGVETNLDLGATHLAKKIKQAGGELRKGLLRYNGGGNPHYPDHVLSWATHFREEN